MYVLFVDAFHRGNGCCHISNIIV